MFKIGDKIVYPMHGAGIIENIEKREIGGESLNYYIIKLLMGAMQAMVPLDKADQVGLREVVNQERIKEALGILKEKSTEMPINWNHRYRLNMDKIRSGDILEVAEVVRNLCHRDSEKGLSTGEKKLYENARKILVSEVILSEGIAEIQANELLDSQLAVPVEA